MAITFTILEDEKKVKATINKTKYDAINRIQKLCRKAAPLNNHKMCVLMGFNYDTLTGEIGKNNYYFMPEKFEAYASFDEVENLDQENMDKLKEMARIRVVNNYHRSLDKRIDTFKYHLNNAVKGFNELI